jgi:hypothetical protein
MRNKMMKRNYKVLFLAIMFLILGISVRLIIPRLAIERHSPEATSIQQCSRLG